MKKNFIILSTVTAISVAVLSVGGFTFLHHVVAEDSLDSYPQIIQNLAEKFNLNPEDVQQVFTDTRKEKISERLDELVQEGTITEEQKNLILEKVDEIQAKREEISNQSLTESERREALQTLQEEVEQWCEDNGIPVGLLKMMGGKGPRGGGHEMGQGMMMEDIPMQDNDVIQMSGF